MPAYGSGTDVADAFDVGMLQERFSLVAAAGHQVHNAFRQAGFDQQLEHAHRSLRGETGCLEHQGISGRDAQRQHPAKRDHARKIERHDGGEDSDGFSVGNRIESLGDVHERIALHQHGRAAGDLNYFDGLQDVAPRFVEVLSQFHRAEQGQIRKMFLQQVLQLEHELRAHAHWSTGPSRKCGLCRLDAAQHFFRRAARRFRHQFARA